MSAKVYLGHQKADIKLQYVANEANNNNNKRTHHTYAELAVMKTTREFDIQSKEQRHSDT